MAACLESIQRTFQVKKGKMQASTIEGKQFFRDAPHHKSWLRSYLSRKSLWLGALIAKFHLNREKDVLPVLSLLKGDHKT